MNIVVNEWLIEEDYDFELEGRKKIIEAARAEIVKLQKRINVLEGEIFVIQENRKKTKLAESKPRLELNIKTKPMLTKDDYNPNWSWYERALFVLKFTQQAASAYDIVTFMGGLEKELREDDRKRRLAQAAIINAFKSRVQKGEIILIKNQKEGYTKYALEEFENK